jgi:hypothetical protein
LNELGRVGVGWVITANLYVNYVIKEESTESQQSTEFPRKISRFIFHRWTFPTGPLEVSRMEESPSGFVMRPISELNKQYDDRFEMNMNYLLDIIDYNTRRVLNIFADTDYNSFHLVLKRVHTSSIISISSSTILDS